MYGLLGWDIWLRYNYKKKLNIEKINFTVQIKF